MSVCTSCNWLQMTPLMTNSVEALVEVLEEHANTNKSVDFCRYMYRK